MYPSCRIQMKRLHCWVAAGYWDEEFSQTLQTLGMLHLVLRNDTPVSVIGAKRGGMREQCSQKLFELAEIFRKMNKMFMNYKYI